MMAVGDSIGYNIENEKLSHLGNLINDNDIFIFNLEGVLVDPREKVSSCEGFPEVQSILTSSSTFAEYMKLAPITIANMANNHVLDCGPEGIEWTKRILLERNIHSLGAGTLGEACEPLFVEAKGWRIAFVSYNFVIIDEVSADTHKSGAASLDTCKHNYSKIRSQGADLIIASIHLGLWSPDVNQEQFEVVNKLFDSGVDIVIGHSPHIPQAIMAKDGNLAFFSLGNFIFRPDYEMPALAHTTFVPRIDLHADKIDVTIYPVRIDDDGIPHIDDNTYIISRIADASAQFNTIIDVHDNLGHISIFVHDLR